MPIKNSDGELFVSEHNIGLLMTDWNPCQYYAAYTSFDVDDISYDLSKTDSHFCPQPIFEIKTDYLSRCTGKDDTCQCQLDYEIA